MSDARGAALSAQRLVPAAEGGWLIGWGDRGGDDLDRMLWPVILSAVDMLSPQYSKGWEAKPPQKVLGHAAEPGIMGWVRGVDFDIIAPAADVFAPTPSVRRQVALDLPTETAHEQ